MGFSRQEYWSGLPLPSPRDLPYPKNKPTSPELQAESFTAEPPGKPQRSKETSTKQGWWSSWQGAFNLIPGSWEASGEEAGLSELARKDSGREDTHPWKVTHTKA